MVSSRLAQSFGGSPADYDRLRPDWPPGAADRAAELLGLARSAELLDPAAGRPIDIVSTRLRA